MSNNIIQMKVEGSSKSHSRTDILARDVECVIDEPIARGGTNLGLSPTETLISSLIGCTNVITHRILEKMGFKVFNMDIEAITKFNRDGVGLLKEVEVPFPEILLNIEISTDASEVGQMKLKNNYQCFVLLLKL